jgi:hypothetical protein
LMTMRHLTNSLETHDYLALHSSGSVPQGL